MQFPEFRRICRSIRGFLVIGCSMKKVVLAFLFLAGSLLFANDSGQKKTSVEFIPVDQIHAGMKGVAYTVFQGTQPEPMDLEVLGILKGNNGPKGDIILIRLKGDKPEYTGVVAGMSGSPVYIEGKLAGALAFRIGQFSKEPIAGVTPIADMLEINELDKVAPATTRVTPMRPEMDATRSSGPGAAPALDNQTQSFINYLKPIDTPLVFSGFSEQAIKAFAPQFASAGIVPVMGVGSVSDKKQPEPIVPGYSAARFDPDLAGS